MLLLLFDVEAVTAAAVGGVEDDMDAMSNDERGVDVDIDDSDDALNCLLASHRLALLLLANSIAFAAASFVLMGLKLTWEAQLGLEQFERPQPLVNWEKYFSIASFALFLFFLNDVILKEIFK
jgi:hypothetical protein